MKIPQLIGLMLAIVIGVVLLPTILESTDSYDTVSLTQSFTATENASTTEDFVTTETATAVNSVTVNGTALVLTTDYTVSGSTVSLVADSSDTGDTVLVNYDYTLEINAGVASLVDLLPVIFTVLIVVGAVAYIKFKR